MALEFFIKNLCTEILQICKREEIECHQNFMLYYLTLLSYDPLWNLHPKMKEIIRMDALRLINYVVAKMRNQNCPCIVSLKMQFYFHCNFKDKEEIVDLESTNFHIRLRPLIEDILDAKPETDAEYDLLFKKIIYYCTLWRGVGNPTIEPVYREAYHAMLSIMDQSDFRQFVNLKPDEKQSQLMQYSQICAGVRIFNWATKKSGEGIEDLPVLFSQVLSSFKSEVSRKLAAYLDKIDILTTAVDLSFVIEEVEVYKQDGICTEYSQTCMIPEGVDYEELEYYKDMIIIYREIEGFARKLLYTIGQMEINYSNLNEQFKECLGRFHNLAYLNAGVPTHTIFPLFIELDSLWEAYQNEIIYTKKMQAILQNLELYVKDFYVNYDRLESIISGEEILTDQDRMEVNIKRPLEDPFFDLHVITPDSEDFDLNDINLELFGFDLWRLVESQGALIPGNPNLGIIEYEDKYYVFSCFESAYMFANYPQRIVNEGLELVRKRTELIPWLQLEERLSEVQTIKQLVIDQKTTELNIAHSDVNIQTETHPIKTNIDESYMWNIWDYKRQALKLADNANRRARATITVVKSSSGAVATQTQNKSDASSQTKHDNYTNTHRPQTYFYGLRGRTDDKQFIMDLTRPPHK